ncbi:MAG: hypothetical protein ACI8YI_001762 [Paracoccaceae bacterium]|jgi:hypothetical protein
METQKTPAQLRLTLAAIGALAGVSFWLLFDVLPDQVKSARFLMLLTAFAGSLFAGLMLLVGRLSVLVALRYVVSIALIASLLLFWASFRYDSIHRFFDSIHPVFAMFFLAQLPLPFVLTHRLSPRGWLDYDGLFDHAWSIFVRMITAWAFTGLFWLVVFMSDQLLELVGFDYLGKLTNKIWVALPLTGLVLGLALAVLNELHTVVSVLRRLALQLLRLLLPLVTVVMALFIVLVPFQGLDQVFGSLSAAGTMLAMAAGAVTLITSAVDGRDIDVTHSKIMVISAKFLAGLLPLIALIAVYAIWVRVAQYGWTPARLSAVLISVIVLAYGVAYASAALQGAAWRARIRGANTWLAVSVIAVSGLWLTPILNVERISANSHAQRFLDGKIGVRDLDVWGLGHDWGKAGAAAFADIRALKDHTDQAALDTKIARFDAGESRWSMREDNDLVEGTELAAELLNILPVRPLGQELPGGIFEDFSIWHLREIITSCQTELLDGRPSCAIVIGSFDRKNAANAAILFWRGAGGLTEISTMVRSLPHSEFRHNAKVSSLGGDANAQPAEALIARILDGDFSFEPVQLDALQIGAVQIFPRNN